jgi:hypothetical protein
VLGLLLVSSPLLARMESLGVVAVVLSSSARHRRVVVLGVLLGVGHCSTARRNVVSILKIEREKKTHRWDQEVTSPSPVGHLVGPPHRHFRRRCHLDPTAVVPVVAVPREPLMSSQFPFLFRTRSLFGNTH